jgi:hypothetical protein
MFGLARLDAQGSVDLHCDWLTLDARAMSPGLNSFAQASVDKAHKDCGRSAAQSFEEAQILLVHSIVGKTDCGDVIHAGELGCNVSQSSILEMGVRVEVVVAAAQRHNKLGPHWPWCLIRFLMHVPCTFEIGPWTSYGEARG